MMSLEKLYRRGKRRRVTPSEWDSLLDFVRALPVKAGEGLLESSNAQGKILSALPTRKGGGGGCPNWKLAVVEGGIVIGAPGTVGAIIPTYDGDPLTDSPPPVIEIPEAEGRYLLYLAISWEPEAVEVFSGQWFMGTGGEVVAVEVVVAAEGTPPTDVAPEIDGTTGAVDVEGLEHVVFAVVDRGAEVEEVPGGLSIANGFLCYSLEWKICGRRVLLGQK